MKKIKKIILVGAILLTNTLLTGCGSTTTNNEVTTKNTVTDTPNVEVVDNVLTYKLSYEGVDLTPGEKFNYEDIKSEKPSISTVTGCAMYGYDHVYTYKNFEVTANINEEEGYELIYSVYFINENYSTPEGIKIGSTVDEMIAAFGEADDEFNGVYTYNGASLYVKVQTKKNVITGIEYILNTN